jgi:TonB family protein
MLVRIASLALVVGLGAAGLAAAQEPIQDGFGQGAYRPGSGASDPVVLREARPDYTDAARQARIQGLVELEAVVEPNGTIQNVRVTKSLDRQHGLDEEAILAAKRWLFKPGYLNGKPVPVLVTLILEFRDPASPRTVRFPKPPGPAGTGTEPVVVREVRPSYTAEARRLGITGHVELEAMVEADGTVGMVRVVRSLDSQYGLDAEAIVAAKQWQFRPGTLKGQPVPTLVTLILEFRQDDQAAQQPKDDEFTKGTYAETLPGIVKPRLYRAVRPNYTSDAMRAKIQGVVEVEAVVLPDGVVDRARVKTSLDKVYGLDQEAVFAALRHRFAPNSGTLDGKPVPVLIVLTMEFRLH